MSPSEVDLIGLGMTAMSLRPGATPLRLATEASTAALTDAQIGRADVDGLLVGSSQGVRPDRLGVGFAAAGGFRDLRLLEHVEIKGATTIAMIQRARHAIATGEASTVLCVFADAPLVAGKGAGSTYAQSGGNAGVRGLERASGLLGSVPTYALLAQRWLHTTGTDPAALRSVAVTARRWARDNPDAVNREPLDEAGYDASPMIAEPLRLLDCARPVNGAVAVLLTNQPSTGPARLRVRGTGRQHPVRRRRAGAESWFGGGRSAVDDALDQAGMSRSDLDIAELYDPFSIVTLLLLDEYRLTGAVPAGDFVRDGQTGPGGTLPTNTGGGQLSGFYLQGMTPLAEAVIQLRGAGGNRQVPNAAVALVGGIGGRLDHHAALVLERAA
ncbi:thiolase family protein [Mycolicibacterium porcinum]|uniref:Thiolase family protein n=1 Tax=Mycolicibacterium porcinum TaxID=39693 RepID=A0AAW5T1C6_9MYCO|nr:thiolase family protein [Mycolicibacterium porcinum]MCV7388054.1 thiolase family protein [Mycolicibacterium porcinum]ORB43417.1 thiolase [Mycolicibacterium porcinum]CDO31261.1 thiolase [Mycolicibacterium vulneris]